MIQENIEEKPSVALGLVVYGGVLQVEFAMSIIETLKHPDLIDGIVTMANDSLVCRARNNLTATFLRTPHTHLLFIDTDIEFEPVHIKKLIDHKKPIVCGLCPKKQLRHEFVFNSAEKHVLNDEGLYEVRYGGTGFMLIERQVFHQMMEAYPETMHYKFMDEGKSNNKEQIFDFWSVGQVDRNYLSEDWYFCHRWNKLGGKVYIDPSVQTKHIGRYKFPAPPEELQTALDTYPTKRDYSKKEAFASG